MDKEQLDRLENGAMMVLATEAKKGNTNAAGTLLAAVERARASQAAERHAERLVALEGSPVALVAYLAGLGQTLDQISKRLGRKLTKAESAAFEQGVEDRLLEVRAIDMSRARRGEADVPAWARRG